MRVAHHALRPEKGGIARSFDHRLYSMQAGTGIHHHMPCRQLDGLSAVHILDDQLATFILVGVTEKQGCGNISTQALSRARNGKNRVIDVVAVFPAPLVTIKAW